jgi:hypothetical protein
MAGVAPSQVKIGAGFAQDLREALGVLGWDHLVPPASRQEDGHPGEVRRRLRLERHHRPEQDRGPQEAWVKEHQARRDVSPVRVADGHEPRQVEPVLLSRSLDKAG